MKKTILAICMIAFISTAYAQKGVNQLGLHAGLGIPTGDLGDAVKAGFSGTVKGLFGVGQAGQITFSTGYTAFKAKGSTSEESATLTIIPLLAGYRHNFSGFYVEPQLGYGVYGARVKFGGETMSDSESGFTWAVGAGYVINKVDLGIRYQSGKPTSGDEESVDWGFFGIHVGYNISFTGKK